MTGQRIVLNTLGSLGDLHPFLAVAKCLRDRGARPIMAVGEDHLEKCKLAGLDAEAVLPSFQNSLDSADTDATLNQILSKRHDLLDMLVSSARETLKPLVKIATGADAIVGSNFSFGAPIAAEILKIPFIFGVLQPMSWFSWHDPPKSGGFEALLKPPSSKVGLVWNHFVGTIISTEVRRRFSHTINQVRAENGLPKSTVPPILRPGTRPALSIGLYSEQLSILPPDAPRPARVVGFPWFDSEDGGPPSLAPEIEAFLRSGPQPLIISLGSFVHHAAGDLIKHAAGQAAVIGLRVLILTDRDCGINHPNVLVRPYAPHSLVFPHSTAIIHHAGIGTLGQALRAGKPQIAIPFFGDQFDNARRMERVGVGLSVSPQRFRRNAKAFLLHILHDQRKRAVSAEVSRRVASEDGAKMAADLILSQFDR